MIRVAVPWRHVRVLELAEWPDGGSAVDSQLASHWFTASELDAVREFRREERRREWMLSRIAAKELALETGLAATPHDLRLTATRIARVSGDQKTPVGWVSLSHSDTAAGAAIGDDPIGLDVQRVRDLSPRAAHLFLNPAEEEAAIHCATNHALLHFWCAKEALWKRHGGEIQTLRQIPLALASARADAMEFDSVATMLTGDLIVAVTRPIF